MWQTPITDRARSCAIVVVPPCGRVGRERNVSEVTGRSVAATSGRGTGVAGAAGGERRWWTDAGRRTRMNSNGGNGTVPLIRPADAPAPAPAPRASDDW